MLKAAACYRVVVIGECSKAGEADKFTLFLQTTSRALDKPNRKLSRPRTRDFVSNQSDAKFADFRADCLQDHSGFTGGGSIPRPLR